MSINVSFKVYQINLTKSEIDEFNDGIPSPRVEAKRDLCIASPQDVANMYRQGLYDHVADVLGSRDLEDAYYIGQFQHHEEFRNHAALRRHSFGMTSISVGDILVHDTGKAFVVAPFGFEELTDEMIEG
jgi:hypothetical protein